MAAGERSLAGQKRSFDADAQTANNRKVRDDVVAAGLRWPTPYWRSLAVAWLEQGLPKTLSKPHPDHCTAAPPGCATP